MRVPAFPSSKEINLFPTLEFGVEGLHLFAMVGGSSFEDVVDFDQHHSDVENIFVSSNIGRGKREDAAAVRITDVPELLEAHDKRLSQPTWS